MREMKKKKLNLTGKYHFGDLNVDGDVIKMYTKIQDIRAWSGFIYVGKSISKLRMDIEFKQIRVLI
jgi:hypothetical protein